jgi:hypothetical protein
MGLQFVTLSHRTGLPVPDTRLADLFVATRTKGAVSALLLTTTWPVAARPVLRFHRDAHHVGTGTHQTWLLLSRGYEFQ